jgi:hydroxymethylpyrimidine pyrophosphatase-like HAD family hydrolase
MGPVVAATGHRGVAICANGAILYDLTTERIVAVRPLDAAAAATFTARLRERLPEVHFAVEADDGSFGHEPGYRPRFPPAGAWRGEIERLLQRRAVKLLARHEGLDADALLAAAGPAVAGLPLELTHSSRDGLLEVSGAGVTKATTLAAVARDSGVGSGEVLAFGDMPNDVPMLTWAGWGVAVADAHPAAIAAADEVAGACAADGVAVVLERVFP